MNKTPSLLEKLWFAIAAKLLGLAMLLGTCLAVIFVLHASEKYHLGVPKIVGALILAVGLLAAAFVSRAFSLVAEDRSMSFVAAVRHTWHYSLSLLSFVPVIGPLAQRFSEDRKKRNPFTSDEK